MSNAIQFLEAMGGQARLSASDYTTAIAALDVDGKQRQALLARNHAALSELLGGRAQMRCYIATPDNG